MAIQLHMTAGQFEKISQADAENESVNVSVMPQLAWLQGVRNHSLWTENKALVKALTAQVIALGALDELQKIAFEAIQVCIASKRPNEKLYWVHWFINGSFSWIIVYRSSSSTRMLTSELVDIECPQLILDMCKQ